MILRRPLFALALALVMGIPTPAAARTPRGRHIPGIVQKVNRQAREAEILRTDGVGALGFVWNSRTTFVANRRFVNSTILQQGARVVVIYHQPFFGRPFVSRVTLLSESGRVRR